MSIPNDIIRNAIVAVLNPDGTVNGTGFFITPDGYILTCYHVVPPTAKIKIKTYSNLVMDASLIEDKSVKDEKIDFAILKIEGVKDLPYLPLDKDCLERDKWRTIGYQYVPEYIGFPLNGEIVGKAEKEIPATREKVCDIVGRADIEIKGGTSGSPLYNERTGKVVGIIKETRKNEAYAVCMEEVFKKWPELEFINLDALAMLQKLCEEFGKKEKKILVVGDVMLDHTLVGDKAKYTAVEKHEAHDNVYMLSKKDNESKSAGGAANIARAFSEISGVTLIGVIGSDYEGKNLVKLCENYVTFDPVEIPEVLTTTKIYFYYVETQGEWSVIRFDREDSKLMEKECLKMQEKIISKIREAAQSSLDGIILKDHEKGLISADIVKEISKIAVDKNIPLFIDPKYSWDKFKDVKIEAIFPNIKEASYGLLGKEEEYEIKKRVAGSRLDDEDYGKLIEKYPDCKNFIIKADRNGAFIASAKIYDGMMPEEVKPLSLKKGDFRTGIGCGDVFDAYAVTGILNGYSPEVSVLLANFAAGLRAKRPLGEVISPDKIKKELKQEPPYVKDYFKDNETLVRNIEKLILENKLKTTVS